MSLCKASSSSFNRLFLLTVVVVFAASFNVTYSASLMRSTGNFLLKLKSKPTQVINNSPTPSYGGEFLRRFRRDSPEIAITRLRAEQHKKKLITKIIHLLRDANVDTAIDQCLAVFQKAGIEVSTVLFKYCLKQANSSSM